jgi:hypothetical protein
MRHPFQLPATAVCPGCQTMVVLPVEPIDGHIPPAICATCGTEVPDQRREYVPPAPEHPEGYVLPKPQAEPTPVEEQRYSRRNLFRSLGGIVAERSIDKVEEVKSRLTDEL